LPLNIKIRYFGKLREIVDEKMEEYTVESGSTLMDLLINYIPKRHSKVSKIWLETVFNTIKGEISFKKDGTSILRNCLVFIKDKSPNLRYEITDGDKVEILPPFGGG
jgi:molybdopterin converting factor small subunit